MKTHVIALLFAVAAPLAAEDSFARVQAAHAQRTDELEAAFRAAQEKAAAAYTADLLTVYRHMTAQNDEFGLRPVKAEAQRFQREKTVPRTSPEGTPELLVKARERYFRSLDPAEAARSNQLRQADAAYRGQLEKFAAAADPDGRAKAELARLAPAPAAASDAAVTRPPISLPASLLPRLRLAYSFVGADAVRVDDLSGQGRHGTLSGTFKLEAGSEGVVREFGRESDQIGIPEQRLGRHWTLLARVQFPLDRSGQPRVLMSGGFRQHHVIVDERGRLGVETGTFTASSADVSGLRGWHEIAAVADEAATYFFIDGKPAGIARAVCTEPIRALGNGATGGQPWGGLVSALLLWDKTFTVAEIAALQSRTRP